MKHLTVKSFRVAENEFLIRKKHGVITTSKTTEIPYAKGEVEMVMWPDISQKQLLNQK